MIEIGDWMDLTAEEILYLKATLVRMAKLEEALRFYAEGSYVPLFEDVSGTKMRVFIIEGGNMIGGQPLIVGDALILTQEQRLKEVDLTSQPKHGKLTIVEFHSAVIAAKRENSELFSEGMAVSLSAFNRFIYQLERELVLEA